VSLSQPFWTGRCPNLSYPRTHIRGRPCSSRSATCWFVVANLHGVLASIFMSYPEGSTVSNGFLVTQAFLIFCGAYVAVFSQVWYLGVVAGSLERSRVLHVAGSATVAYVALTVVFRRSIPPDLPRAVVSFYAYAIPLGGVVYVLTLLSYITLRDGEGGPGVINNIFDIFCSPFSAPWRTSCSS
jgi:hypothetical protein